MSTGSATAAKVKKAKPKKIKIDTSSVNLQPVARMSKDIVQAGVTLGDQGARFLVDTYYTMQENRKRTANQMRALDVSGEPNLVLAWLTEQNVTLEGQIKRALDKYTEVHPMGAWMREIHGIGPVISAGLLAHLGVERWVCVIPKTNKNDDSDDEESDGGEDEKPTKKEEPIVHCSASNPCTPRCHKETTNTVGHWWRFGGLDPSVKWMSAVDCMEWISENGLNVNLAATYFGRNADSLMRMASHDSHGKPIHVTAKSLSAALARQPWNKKLKTLFWKVGQSFMKFSGNEECYYGHLYKQRKAEEVAKNESGKNREAALARASKVGAHTAARKHLEAGKLPPGQVDGRARRWVVKIFLSHLHAAWYKQHFGIDAPKPFADAILGHAHMIPPSAHVVKTEARASAKVVPIRKTDALSDREIDKRIKIDKWIKLDLVVPINKRVSGILSDVQRDTQGNYDITDGAGYTVAVAVKVSADETDYMLCTIVNSKNHKDPWYLGLEEKSVVNKVVRCIEAHLQAGISKKVTVKIDKVFTL